ncbi:MAG TPA: HAMP domain-containing sensor histidine kinase [Verrucomicrobiae bacterium]
MKKVALVFVLAVLTPSLLLAWLAVRSLRDQQYLIERQHSLLCQGVADVLAKDMQDALSEQQRAFTAKVAGLLATKTPLELAKGFDAALRKEWPLAQIGFVVKLSGEILSPTAADGVDERKFLEANSRFLANRESAEVYFNSKLMALNTSPNVQTSQPEPSAQTENSLDFAKRYGLKSQVRNVMPQQQQAFLSQKLSSADESQQQVSKLAPAEAEFRQLIGDDTEGTLARFLDNKLNVLCWCRVPREPEVVFGAQLSLPRLEAELQPLLQRVPAQLQHDICVALLDDTAKPVALSKTGFRAAWKRPFVATEVGEALPHWEVAVYLVNPAKLTQAARNIRLTLGLLILVLVIAIGVGSWLIVADLNRHLTLARQKTDFVSNVSHELKTPLTSIRMFSELLAEGRVGDPAKQRSYLAIITAEAARLTRLINNVLDFARLERGEKKYNFQPCDIVAVVRDTAESYRPHLEAAGFRFTCELPPEPIVVNGDRDALAQVIVNLLSNAEKYSDRCKEVTVRVTQRATPLPYLEVSVSDRGLGVPRGSAEKIFEKFYRAHDSLSSGIQGSGLGLTLARQIARAHGGEVVYEPRDGGGSCFNLRLPVIAPERT